MTIKLKNGGPAFPLESSPVGIAAPRQTGMSLRDYFAAHAPKVPDDYEWKTVLKIVVGPSGEQKEVSSFELSTVRLIRWRVEYADRMLAALSE